MSARHPWTENDGCRRITLPSHGGPRMISLCVKNRAYSFLPLLFSHWTPGPPPYRPTLSNLFRLHTHEHILPFSHFRIGKKTKVYIHVVQIFLLSVGDEKCCSVCGAKSDLMSGGISCSHYWVLSATHKKE